jgi:hypothetical protein
MAGPDYSTDRGRQTSLPPVAIERTLDLLIMERQQLREAASGEGQLEANRQAICYWQHELAEARRSDALRQKLGA